MPSSQISKSSYRSEWFLGDPVTLASQTTYTGGVFSNTNTNDSYFVKNGAFCFVNEQGVKYTDQQLAQQFGITLTPGPAGEYDSQIPEPVALSLLSAAAAGFCLRRPTSRG